MLHDGSGWRASVLRVKAYASSTLVDTPVAAPARDYSCLTR